MEYRSSLHAVGLIAEAIFRLGRGDLDCLSRHVLGLNGDRGIKRWWLRFDVIEDLLDYVWVSDVGNDTLLLSVLPGICKN